MSLTDTEAMALAIATTRQGIRAGQSPFGAVILRAGELVAANHNQVWATTDPSAHAEVVAIRAAAAGLGTISLAGCSIYCTCEPCPMCMSAIHWAKFDRVVYGAAIADAAAAGFSELRLPAQTLVAMSGSPVKIEAGLLAAECRQLFADWHAAGGRPY